MILAAIEKKRNKTPMEVLEEQKVGRPALISQEYLDEMKAWAVAQDKNQSSSIRTTLENKVLEVMRKQADETTGRPDVVQLPSKGTLDTIRKLVMPVKVKLSLHTECGPVDGGTRYVHGNLHVSGGGSGL